MPARSARVRSSGRPSGLPAPRTRALPQVILRHRYRPPSADSPTVHRVNPNRVHGTGGGPYSEAGFKTLKYRPDFPERFDDIEHARRHCRAFGEWYNHAHRHSGIGLMTPAAVHHGNATQLHAARASVLDAAYQRHPERFVRKPPAPPQLPTAAWINKPKEVTAH
jgi:transposase InsO family protein